MQACCNKRRSTCTAPLSTCCKCRRKAHAVNAKQCLLSLAPGSEIRMVCEQTVRDVCCRAWPWWSQGRFHSGSALYSLPSKLNTTDVRVHIPECFMTVSRGRSCVWVHTTNVVNECNAALVKTLLLILICGLGTCCRPYSVPPAALRVTAKRRHILRA